MRVRLLLGGFALFLPSAAVAQDAAVNAAAPPSAERERVSIVAISAGRLGLLIPLSDRWMVRPDFAVWGYNTSGAGNSDARIFGGVSLIRRGTPVNGSWVYASLRYGIRFWGDYNPEPPSVAHALTATVGAHGRINDWLAGFGEAGPAISYSPELNVGQGDATRDLDFVARIGLAIQMPRSESRATAPDAAPVRKLPREGERPSWIVGGFGAGGLLIPFTDRLALRPDLAFNASSQEPSWSQTTTDAGLSLLRRFRPTDQGWTFGAVRYGLGYSQAQALRPSWIQHASLTVGAHARLRDRLGLMAEAGIDFRYTEVRSSGQLVTGRLVSMIQRVGLTYRWKDRTP